MNNVRQFYYNILTDFVKLKNVFFWYKNRPWDQAPWAVSDGLDNF